jgi:hypothetical protein
MLGISLKELRTSGLESFSLCDRRGYIFVVHTSSPEPTMVVQHILDTHLWNE